MADSSLSNTVHYNYLRDLGTLIKEYALEAKEEKEKSGSAFDTGYVAGFHRVVSLMQQQAEAFGISLGDIGLEGIDPDRDLI